MTPIPYKIEAFQSPTDGKWYGKLLYAGAVVHEAEFGFKKSEDLTKYLRGEAVKHKWSISPQASHKIEQSFSL